MRLIPLLMRPLLQRVSTAALSSASSKIVPKPNTSTPAFGCTESAVIMRLSSSVGGTSTRKEKAHSNSKDAKNTKNAGQPDKEDWTTYRNYRGEEFMYQRSDPPPGFVFVPSGNAHHTRRCRELAQNWYAVYPRYRAKTHRKPTRQMGLYVPKSSLVEAESEYKAKRAKAKAENKAKRAKAESEYKARRAKLTEVISPALDKMYPKIPLIDKNAFHSHVLSHYEGAVGKLAQEISGIAYAYVRDKYTGVKYSTTLSAKGKKPRVKKRRLKKMNQAHQKAEEILASWRGEEPGKQSSKKSEKT